MRKTSIRLYEFKLLDEINFSSLFLFLLPIIQPVDTTRKGSLHVERQNSAISCYAGAD